MPGRSDLRGTRLAVLLLSGIAQPHSLHFEDSGAEEAGLKLDADKSPPHKGPQGLLPCPDLIAAAFAKGQEMSQELPVPAGV